MIDTLLNELSMYFMTDFDKTAEVRVFQVFKLRTHIEANNSSDVCIVY
jgi:hypothetical protein